MGLDFLVLKSASLLLRKGVRLGTRRTSLKVKPSFNSTTRLLDVGLCLNRLWGLRRYDFFKVLYENVYLLVRKNLKHCSVVNL